MTGTFAKRYPDPGARQRAAGNYAWLAGLAPAAYLPRMLPAPDPGHLSFEHVAGRHALPGDLTVLAVVLGNLHAVVHERQLNRARLHAPFTTPNGRVLPAFPDRRLDAVARELQAGRVPGARLTASEARELIAAADGPAAIYKDANPRNFLITPAGGVVMLDFDDLTLAPFGYDLAKLVVTTAMTHGPLPRDAITAALGSYNTAAARHQESPPGVSWDELMRWAEVHHILTSRYAADGRYPFRWDQARPATPAPRR